MTPSWDPWLGLLFLVGVIIFVWLDVRKKGGDE